MMSFGEFSLAMRSASERTQPVLHSLVLDVTMDALTIARSLVGQERGEWPPLAPDTVRRKARRGQTGRVSATDPLLATGAMRDSYEAGVVELTGVVGSSDPRALWHELGAHLPHGTIPPRPVVSLAMLMATETLPAMIEAAAQQILVGDT